MRQPRILVIQDISLSCRISMNVAVPILSCLGNWVSMLPTALLSTHTGKGFEDYTFLDLTDEIPPILTHWRSLGIRFDGIVIGYLGSLKQVNLMKEIISEFTAKEALVVLDPVMGDNGLLYTGYTMQRVEAMRELCQYADVIIPNLTEAHFLADAPYPEKKYQNGQIADVIRHLQQMGGKKIVLSGISFEPEKMGAALIAKPAEGIQFSFARGYPGHFDGTGDLFTSVIAGLLFQHKTLKQAADAAVEYVSRVVKRTIDEQADPLYGVVFEKDLPFLLQQVHGEQAD